MQRVAAALAELGEPAAYPPTPDKNCDVVMKGGVTSGVVYPLAVCELARTFRYRNIGGTSAGAIAAAGTAAAELARQRDGSGAGFAALARLPDWLGEKEHLFALFQPQRRTAPLFQIAAAYTDQRNGGPFAASLAALRGFWDAALLGAVPGAALLALALVSLVRAFAGAPADGLARATALALVLAGAALLLLGAVTALAIVITLRVARAIPENYYGLSTGFSPARTDGVPALTPWLCEELNRLAGLPDPRRPLTFGDLWGLDRAWREHDLARWDDAVRGCVEDPGRRTVNLEMMTTCLAQGRPYRFPFAPQTSRSLYFHPREFRAFFPADVVEWMAAHPSRATGDPRADALAQARSCLPFPDSVDLPVIVATRMSLSVPPLISAVPLYAVDYTQEPLTLERCWFTDGGLTCNFPVHFFDAPLPRWPTFGINLRPLRPGQALADDPCDNVYMAETNGEDPTARDAGILLPWIRFEAAPPPAAGAGPAPPRGGLAGFFAAIVHTMQNWTDNLQLVQPGYRDRVVHVQLAAQEGGANLRMDGATITGLVARGWCAGARLRRRFATPEGDGTELTWDNHRWLRYRRAMASLQTFLDHFARAYTAPQRDGRSYAQLVARGPAEPPASYRWGESQQERFAARATDEMIQMGEQWGTQTTGFAAGAPEPENPLRLVPPQ